MERSEPWELAKVGKNQEYWPDLYCCMEGEDDRKVQGTRMMQEAVDDLHTVENQIDEIQKKTQV